MSDSIPELPDKYKPDTVNIARTRNERHKFLLKLDKVQKEYFAKGKPYWYRGAKKTFEKMQEEQRPKQGKNDTRDVVIKDFNFKRYGVDSLWINLGERWEKEPRLIQGIRSHVHHKYIEYQCKEDGSRLSVKSKEKPRLDRYEEEDGTARAGSKASKS